MDGGRRLLSLTRRLSTVSPTEQDQLAKRHLVVLGSGWGGFTFLKKLDRSRWRVSLVSPVTQFSFTPLLAQAAVGTLDFRNVIEPVRAARDVSFHHAWCDSVRFSHRQLELTPASKPELELENKSERHDTHADRQPYRLHYDQLVIAVGSYNQTFNTPGVKQHAWFLKDVADARRIRWRILQLFEQAAHPWYSHADRRKLLSFVVVGGGPTGSEFAAELHDLIAHEVAAIFPALKPLVSITLLDAGSAILNSFDTSLSAYAMKKFARDRIHVRLNQRITRVQPGHIVLDNDATGNETTLPFGLLVWSTGIKPSPLTESLTGVSKHQRTGTLLTDDTLRLLDQNGNPLPNVHAIGDCATMHSTPLPATAQVASQKATYLANRLNSPPSSSPGAGQDKPFVYSNRGAMASIGGARALIDLPNRKEAGFFAWVMWRGAYTFMSMTWRNRLAVPFTWFLNMLFGRDVSRF